MKAASPGRYLSGFLTFFAKALTPFKPSCIEPIICSFFGMSHQVDVLRDDLIHPVVSGNKWRKLRHFIEHVKQTGKQPIVTFGGAFSNHLVATAFAGKYFNLPTHAFVRGDEDRAPNAYEKACLQNGMTLHHVSRTVYRDKKKLFEDFRQANPGAVFLDEGGDHELALQGCADILDELPEVYDYIILATGTGTTMEGLVKGIIDKKLKTKVAGISVLKNNLDIDRRLEPYRRDSWQVFHDYHRGKYAKTDPVLLEFIAAFREETGILLDPVYTGKMMLAAIDLFKQGFFKITDRILVIHTGGVPAV